MNAMNSEEMEKTNDGSGKPERDQMTKKTYNVTPLEEDILDLTAPVDALNLSPAEDDLDLMESAAHLQPNKKTPQRDEILDGFRKPQVSSTSQVASQHRETMQQQLDFLPANHRPSSQYQSHCKGNGAVKNQTGFRGQHRRAKEINRKIGPHLHSKHTARTSAMCGAPPPRCTVPVPFCYNMVDIGANLTHRRFSQDVGGVIQRAKESGVKTIIVTGLNLHSSQEALMLTRRYPGSLFFTAGVHPHNAKTWKVDSLACLEGLANQPECVAIGECGLDYNRNFSSPEVQLEVFEKQVEIACQLQKPLFLHERDSHGPFVEILSRYHSQLPPVVIHCFTGTREQALKYLAMGFFIGITGYICKDHKANGPRQLLADGDIPLDKLLLETDAPFMYPNFSRGGFDSHVLAAVTEDGRTAATYANFSRNESCSMALITELVAGLMGRSAEDVAEATAQNSRSFFRLQRMPDELL